MTSPGSSTEDRLQTSSAVRILVIDDELDLLTAVSGTLRRAGYCVRTAHSAERGLTLLEQEAADVVITDIIMPRKSGIDVIATVRALYASARIIAMSGGGNFGPTDYRPGSITTSAYLLASERHGAHAVLAKPFEASELLASIRQVLGA